MNSVRRTVLDCRLQTNDDSAVIQCLNELVAKHGNSVCQAIFHIYAGLELPVEQAEEYWNGLLHHQQSMSLHLDRQVGLIASICDFLHNSEYPFTNPRIIEEKAYEKVILETTHDSLTSLFNRQYFDEVLQQNLSLAKRYNTDLSLLFLDIDDFKDVNDTYGHNQGDITLKTIAEIIGNEKRDSDIAARYGGEEFVLLMPHTESINAYILAERIRKKVAASILGTPDKDFSVTISGGLASYPQNAIDSNELLIKADNALYLAKGEGKNTISMFKEEKRRYLRVKFKESIMVKKLGFDSTEAFDGTSKDICIGGILFENSATFPIGSRIQVSIPIKDSKPLLLIGTVVRVEAYGDDRYDIGMTISFKEMEKIAYNEIAAVLKNSKTEDNGKQ